MKAIEELLKISSRRLGDDLIVALPDILSTSGRLDQQLGDLLMLRNGFYAFEGALRVFPSAASAMSRSLEAWNEKMLWRSEYGELLEGKLFFAEDAFGNQFCIDGDSICFLDSESAETRTLATSFDDWASLLMSDYDFQTGYPLMHEWQKKHGRIPNNYRLIPRIPFVLGGDYALDNLTAMDCVEAMRARGNIAGQIYGLPEGAKVEIRLEDYPRNKSPD